MNEVFRALGALLDAPDLSLAKVADALDLCPLPTPAEHTQALVFSLYPYASVYLGEEGMIGGEARDRIAGFLRATGMTVPTEPDHIGFLLASYAAIDVPNVKRAFLWEHLMSFLTAYATAMRALEIPFYVRWATMLEQALDVEQRTHGPPDRLPKHFVETAPFSASDDVLRGILSPMRSGMIIVRRDIARMARDLGLGLRQGERKWALEALLSQDPHAVIQWLAGEAQSWCRRHRASKNPLAAEWADRADRTSHVLLSEVRHAV